MTSRKLARCCTGLLAALALATFAHSKEATVTVNTRDLSEWTVDRMLFGRFFEHHGCDAYPGIYEQYLVNSSFEEYYRKGPDSPTPLKDVKPWLVFEGVEQVQGLAYPWQPFGNAPAQYTLSPDAFNSQTAQQLTTTTAAECTGVTQKIALPDYRIGRYNLRFYAKAARDRQPAIVRLLDHQTGDILAAAELLLSTDYRQYATLLDIGDTQAASRHAGRHGIFDLVIGLNAPGQILIDQATLFADDAVEGKYNPETIQHLKDAGVTVIRWPGGNFASGYHWRDGVGPIDQRPTTPNLAWQGLESNHLGTDEFLQFCELAGLTPLVCVAFDTAAPQEAAQWIQYCNSPADSELGMLRARNGRHEPYRVKLWQVGNEVYGSYQIGHTNAQDYATRYLEYYHAMKQADPSISIMAMGRDPGYHTDDDNAWNRTLFNTIGHRMDYLDIHRYVRGHRNADELANWDLRELAEVYLSYPAQYDVIIDSIRQVAQAGQHDSVKLAVTEWAQYLTQPHPSLPHSYSHANAVFYAGMMNCFLRNGDFVRISCSHDFSVFAGNRTPWNVPVLPRSHVARLYAEIHADRLLQSHVECDSFDLDRKITQMIQLKDIPFIDAVALATQDHSQLALFLVNRSVASDYHVRLDLQGLTGQRQGELLLFSAARDPMQAQTWNNPHVSAISRQPVTITNSRLEFTAPPCTLTRLLLTN